MRAYSIYARVVGVSENERLSVANEWVFWYKNNSCVNTVQSTSHAVICLFYTYWDFSTPTRFSPSIRQNKYQVMFSFRPSASTSLLPASSDPSVMHQSIPAVLTPPGQPRGICSRPGVGAFAILSRPLGLGISIPRSDRRAFDTRVFERQISLSGRTRPLSKTGLTIRDWKNFSMFLKVCFLNFRYFFITWKHINISDKVNYILFITKQSLTWTLYGHDYFAFRIQN